LFKTILKLNDYIAFALLVLSYELLIFFGLPCTLQSIPFEHWTTVKKSFSSTTNERRRNWCLSK